MDKGELALGRIGGDALPGRGLERCVEIGKLWWRRFIEFQLQAPGEVFVMPDGGCRVAVRGGEFHEPPQRLKAHGAELNELRKEPKTSFHAGGTGAFRSSVQDCRFKLVLEARALNGGPLLEGLSRQGRAIKKWAGIKPEQKFRVLDLVCRGAFLEAPEIAFLYRRPEGHLIARRCKDRGILRRQGLKFEDDLAKAGLGLLLEAIGPQHIEQDFAVFTARFLGGEIGQKRLATAQRNRNDFRPVFRERKPAKEFQLHPAPICVSMVPRFKWGSFAQRSGGTPVLKLY